MIIGYNVYQLNVIMSTIKWLSSCYLFLIPHCYLSKFILGEIKIVMTNFGSLSWCNSNICGKHFIDLVWKTYCVLNHLHKTSYWSENFQNVNQINANRHMFYFYWPKILIFQHTRTTPQHLFCGQNQALWFYTQSTIFFSPQKN